MTTATIHEAKTHLSRLVAEALAGGEVILLRGKTPVVRLVPIEPVKKPDRVPGWLAHEKPPGADSITGPAFWEPLSDEEAGLAELANDPLSPNFKP